MQVQALEEHCVSRKIPSSVIDRDEGGAGRNGRDKYFSNMGSYNLTMIFYKKKTEKMS